MSPAKLFAAPTSESVRLSGEKSAQIHSVAVRHRVWRLQSPKLTARSLGFFESNPSDRLQCKSHHSFQARYERSSGNLALQFGADDGVVLAMDRETIGKMSPPIQPVADNALHRNSPSAVAEHWIRPSNRSIPRKFLFGSRRASVQRNEPSPHPRSTCNGALRPKIFSRSSCCVSESRDCGITREQTCLR